MKKVLLILLMAILSSSLVSATYIKGDIIIKPNGDAELKLETDKTLDIQGIEQIENKISGTTSALTSKDGEFWTFNIDFGEFDEIFIVISLPKNLQEVTSIEGSKNIIDFEKKKVAILDSGNLNFKISYTLNDRLSFVFLLWPLLALIIIAGFLLYNNSKKKKQKLLQIMPLINETEQKIIDSLMKGPLRQKELRKSLDIPKASFSRYVINLEKKKLIVREGESKNKILKLK